MQRTHIYLPEELNNQIASLSKTSGKSKAEIIRQVLEQGLKVVRPKKSSSAKILLEIAKEAERLNIKGPRDLSINHDFYTWGGSKRNPEAQE